MQKKLTCARVLKLLCGGFAANQTLSMHGFYGVCTKPLIMVKGKGKRKCTRCGKRAVFSAGYGPDAYCKGHFLWFFEHRVRRTIRMNNLVGKGEKIAVGVSGGKDSAVALFLLNKILGKRNRIVAVLIDEGIPGYRDRALEIARANCGKLGVEIGERDFAGAYGFTMIDVAKKTKNKKALGSACSFCGVLRRSLMNKTALEIGAAKIATGHNLDDETQSILMNFFENDLARMARLGPVNAAGAAGFVPRIKPLYECPEREVELFAKLAGIAHYPKEKSCPYRGEAKRNFFRHTLDMAEQEFPGTKFKVLKSFSQLKPKISGLAGASGLHYCKNCGSPTSAKGGECKACVQMEKLGFGPKPKTNKI